MRRGDRLASFEALRQNDAALDGAVSGADYADVVSVAVRVFAEFYGGGALAGTG